MERNSRDREKETGRKRQGERDREKETERKRQRERDGEKDTEEINHIYCVVGMGWCGNRREAKVLNVCLRHI
jgi:hypothetical protein